MTVARRLTRIGIGVAMLAAGLAGTPLRAAAAPRPARAATPCSSYPRPGSTVHAATPRSLTAEYGVLRRPRRAVDRLGIRHLRSLTASGIVVQGIRFLGRAAFGGKVYLVPAHHLLAFTLAPARCLPRSRRRLQRTLIPSLRREYRHRALCLVVVYAQQDSTTCDRAPGTFDPLLYAPGSPGFGIAPDGVPAVVVHYFTSPPRRIAVHRNFWILNDHKQLETPCGVNWITSGGTVLRRVKSCTHDAD